MIYWMDVIYIHKCKRESMYAVVLNIVSNRRLDVSREREEGEIQVANRGKKMQAQMRRHAIRNSISLERKVSQPISIILGCVRLSVAEN